MRVTVVQMRAQGIKLHPDQLRAVAPRAGYLSLASWHLKNSREYRVILTLSLRSAATDTAPVLLSLNDVAITKLRGTSMVYVGTEGVGGVPYAQAWWVRLEPESVTATHYAQAGKRAEV